MCHRLWCDGRGHVVISLFRGFLGREQHRLHAERFGRVARRFLPERKGRDDRRTHPLEPCVLEQSANASPSGRAPPIQLAQSFGSLTMDWDNCLALTMSAIDTRPPGFSTGYSSPITRRSPIAGGLWGARIVSCFHIGDAPRTDAVQLERHALGAGPRGVHHLRGHRREAARCQRPTAGGERWLSLPDV